MRDMFHGAYQHSQTGQESKPLDSHAKVLAPSEAERLHCSWFWATKI